MQIWIRNTVFVLANLRICNCGMSPRICGFLLTMRRLRSRNKHHVATKPKNIGWKQKSLDWLPWLYRWEQSFLWRICSWCACLLWTCSGTQSDLHKGEILTKRVRMNMLIKNLHFIGPYHAWDSTRRWWPYVCLQRTGKHSYKCKTKFVCINPVLW